MGSFPLTKKQQRVLQFLERYFNEHKQSPLIREIQLGCEILSYKSALDRLNALERKGFIKRLPNKHRGIQLVRDLAAVVADTSVVAQPQRQEEGLPV